MSRRVLEDWELRQDAHYLVSNMRGASEGDGSCRSAYLRDLQKATPGQLVKIIGYAFDLQVLWTPDGNRRY